MKRIRKNVFLVLTSRCNSKCITCDYWKCGKRTKLTIEQVVKAFEEINRHFHIGDVFLTGGEPILNDQLVQIAQHIKKTYKTHIVLSTNGICVHKMLHKLDNVIDNYCVSFDAHDRKLYKKIRGVDAFDRVLQVPRQTSKPVIATALIQKLNHRFLDEIYCSAKRNRFCGISFVVPHFSGCGFGGITRPKEKVMLSSNDVEILGKQFCNILHAESSSPTQFLLTSKKSLIEYLHYFSGKKNNRRCNVYQNSIIIDSDGQIKFCFYLPYTVGDIDHMHEISWFETVQQARVKTHCQNCYQFMG